MRSAFYLYFHGRRYLFIYLFIYLLFIICCHDTYTEESEFDLVWFYGV